MAEKSNNRWQLTVNRASYTGADLAPFHLAVHMEEILLLMEPNPGTTLSEHTSRPGRTLLMMKPVPGTTYFPGNIRELLPAKPISNLSSDNSRPFRHSQTTASFSSPSPSAAEAKSARHMAKTHDCSDPFGNSNRFSSFLSLLSVCHYSVNFGEIPGHIC
jgi:hypothetical protein